MHPPPESDFTDVAYYYYACYANNWALGEFPHVLEVEHLQNMVCNSVELLYTNIGIRYTPYRQPLNELDNWRLCHQLQCDSSSSLNDSINYCSSDHCLPISSAFIKSRSLSVTHLLLALLIMMYEDDR